MASAVRYIAEIMTILSRMAMQLKGIPYKYVPVNLLKNEQKSDEYTRMNPNKTVPSIVLEDGTVLTQSVAIMEYLEETYSDVRLLPEDPRARAIVRQIVLLISVGRSIRLIRYYLVRYSTCSKSAGA